MKKYNVKTTKRLSDQEIESFKDYTRFEAKLKKAKTKARVKKGIVGSLLTGAVLFVAVHYMNEKPTQITEKLPTTEAPIPVNNVNLRATASFWDSVEVKQIEKGVKWMTSSGTLVVIPKQALVNQAGEPVTGNIQLKINEFNDSIDAALSGVKMTYDSAGYEYHFKTGGMFDLRAYQQGEELAIKPGEKISIFMNSTADNDNFNAYYFNDSANQWEYKGENKMAKRTIEKANNITPTIEVDSVVEEAPNYPPLKLDFDPKDFPELAAY